MDADVDLAADGGQSGLRMAVVRPADGAGTAPVLDRVVDVPGFAWGSGVDPTGSHVDVIERAWRALGSPGPVGTLACGLSAGPGEREEAHRLGAALAARLGARRVVVAGDDLTTHAGALGGRPGVVLAAGTGVVCTSVDAAGVRVRTDAWGYLLGDAGGGSWLGREGLRAAFAGLEGRGPATALTGRAEERFGEPRAFVRRVLAAPTMVAEIASFARDVVGCAAAGDEVAAELCERAAGELAATAAATVRQGFPGGEAVPFAWTGSVLTATEVVRSRFLRRLAEVCPQARPRAPLGGGLDGAALLATTAGTPHHALAWEVRAAQTHTEGTR